MKGIVLAMLLSLLVISLSGIAQASQGRMGGMSDPYGLISDESDFLIHPAKIAKGEGLRFYGDYRFTYTGVLNWDNELDVFSPLGALTAIWPKETSGDELRHNILVGGSFPLGPGRMGLFFTYAGMRGDYDGNLNEWYPPFTQPSWFDTCDLHGDLDDFAFRLLYGLPVGSFKLGGEVQVAYRQEENRSVFNFEMAPGVYFQWTNDFGFGPFGSGIENISNSFPFMMPYDSRYWEALLKGSLEGKVGALDLEFTLRGGFLFAGDNQYEYEWQAPIGTPVERFDLNGDVSGWRIGGDLWLCYPLAEDLSLPFLVRVDYQEKTRDGDGPGLLGLTGSNYSYKSQEQSLGITVGGGLEKELSKAAKIAAGIYYNYLRGNNDFRLMRYVFVPGVGNVVNNYDYSDYPSSTEHQIMLRLAGELELSPIVTLRMGLAPFYGWVREYYKFSFFITPTGIGDTDDVPTDGYHWGIGASLGATMKFKPITLEPFINGGWQQLHLKGDGDEVVIPTGS